MANDLIVVIGAFGSGKSEYAINLAWSRRAEQPFLVDLDVVNPYFRSRDVRELFAADGIDVIAPEGAYSHADLPMISPRIRSAVIDRDRPVILDVGGDPNGCRALARFTQSIRERGYNMTLVVNTRRPFTADAGGIGEMLHMLQKVSGLKVSELVCNTNLMEHTDAAVVEEGVRIVRQAADEHNLPFSQFLVLDAYADKVPDEIGGVKKMVLSYFLRKPWETTGYRGQGI
ncbi:MAG: hypothetical protein K8R90_06390 [Candidatus Cloacimonetes bacterium]|nr:hypothetical protein [Candidatus Cloacimonadota bacterium]